MGTCVGVLLLAKANSPHGQKEKLPFVIFPVLFCNSLALKDVPPIFPATGTRRSLARSQLLPRPLVPRMLLDLPATGPDVDFCAQGCAGS